MDEGQYESSSGLLASVARFKWAVAVCVLLGGAAGYALAAQKPTLYQASATLLLADPRSETVLTESRQAGGDPGRYVRNQARFVTSQPVLQRAAALLGAPGGLVFVSAEGVTDIDSIVITAVDTDPERAARVADAAALAYEQIRTEQREKAAQEAIVALQRARAEVEQQLIDIATDLAANPNSPAALAEREAASQQLQILLTRERQLAVDTALFGGGVDLREPANVPAAPFQPQPLRGAGTGVVLALAASSAAAWWWNMRRPAGVERSRVERLLGAPLLAEVPRFSRYLGSFPAAVDTLSTEAEAYQFLVAAINQEMRKRGARSILVTSAAAGDGKTVTAVNMALMANRDGHRVVLVDADVRVRGLTRLTEVSTPLGLEEIARDSVPVRRCLVTPQLEGLEELRIVGVDDGEMSDNPAGFLRSQGFGYAIKRLQEVADLVIIDSPPVLAVADTFEMVPYVDVVLVVLSATTEDTQIESLKRRLDLAGAHVVGYVVNRSGSSRDLYAYGTTAYGPTVTGPVSHEPVADDRAADAEPDDSSHVRTPYEGLHAADHPSLSGLSQDPPAQSSTGITLAPDGGAPQRPSAG